MTPKRISIVCADLGALPRAAIEYLILNLNTRQEEVEFEILPLDTNQPLVASIGAGRTVDLLQFKRLAAKFAELLPSMMSSASRSHEVPESAVGRVVFLSVAANDHHFYEVWEPEYSAVFLGDWDVSMAPPSLAESLLTMVMLEGLLALVPNPQEFSHYGTRGCVGDFNATLRDCRYKVLQGFLCSDCRTRLDRAVGAEVSNRWVTLLSKNWIGRTEEPASPAGIVRKLGYDLFVTKGYAPTRRERLIQLLEQDGAKELVKIVGGILGGVVLGALVLWLGLKR